MNSTSPSRGLTWVLVVLALGAPLGIFGYMYLSRPPADVGEPPPVGPFEEPDDLAQQAHQFCGACHAYPPAETFPREHWRVEVERGYRFFERSGLSLRPPPVESVVRYYEEQAAEELPAAEFTSAPGPAPVRFNQQTPPGPEIGDRYAISNVNPVRLEGDSGPLDILACEMRGGLVMRLRPTATSPAWEVIARAPHPARTHVVDLDGDGIRDILVADLGSFPPTDRRCGSVVWLRGQPDGSFESVTLLKDVGRVSDVRAADFRGVGQLDLVVAVFGWQSTGEIIYLENHTTDWENPVFEPRVIDSRHGTIHVPIADLNGDARPDFVAVLGQEHEAVVAFLNQGDGTFRQRPLFTASHPGYGSSGIELVDLDADQDLDVLYTNGDTLDEPYLFKPYHGVQWLENKGDLEFVHHPLTPMYGVHAATAGDLTGNGLPDVVAVSFLPEDKFPQRKAQEGTDAVILLEQVEPGVFRRHSLDVETCDHVTCAVGDLDGTGQLDLIIGQFSSYTVDAPVTIWKHAGGTARLSPDRPGAGTDPPTIRTPADSSDPVAAH